ncbi:MAG: hydantoinase/oxoprolinase family protein [Bacillota bacterium]|nr:hydantoinase/oxoprolinase family protein [Bacillota bacterium]
MLIGIDVGGTFTDGVLFDGKKVLQMVKVPTDHQNIKDTILSVLDEVREGNESEDLERIVLSTTVVTNLLATDSIEKPGLVLIPGPGLPFSSYEFFPHIYFIHGAIDFRGREIEKLRKEELAELVTQIKSQSIKKIAVVGKFSNRNPIHEQTVRKFLLEQIPGLEICVGAECASRLNFRRRLVTSYYSVMTQGKWQDFTSEIKQALSLRKISCKVDILKADGGTLPLDISGSQPCETIFSGPAASTMGAVALTRKKTNAVVIDIGGTTSDISLLIDGDPLYASKGANINGHYTHTRAFAVRSVALGGDSPVMMHDGKADLGIQRIEQAACFGGGQPCVTDVFNYLYDLNIGNAASSRQSLQQLANQHNMDIDNLSKRIENIVFDRLQEAIEQMFAEWENEPAYKVWEVVNGRKFGLDEIIGIGAGAGPIVPILAKRLDVQAFIPPYGAVANALGACVSRPTLSVLLRADTESGYVSTDHEGSMKKINNPRAFQLADAKSLAEDSLRELAAQRGVASYASEAEFFLEEQFNMIRGWSSAGKIIEVGLQVTPGLIESFEGVKE